LLPDRWMPQYAMIAFSHIPLSEVEVRSKLQMRILDELVARYSVDELENDNRLKEIVSGRVTELSIR
ncbi:MAG TPA: hypothetical protein VJ983_09040, partial [candidate division Zixibacteria bacterium]|nr:hypothetical protein [candidate division Zixibacteria bacterium]